LKGDTIITLTVEAPQPRQTGPMMTTVFTVFPFLNGEFFTGIFTLRNRRKNRQKWWKNGAEMGRNTHYTEFRLVLTGDQSAW